MIKCVICCQGTTQLLTAAAAVSAYGNKSGLNIQPDDVILLIYDLYCPTALVVNFRDAIRNIALLNHGWENFEVLDAGIESLNEASNKEIPLSVPKFDSSDVEVVFSCRMNNAHDRQIYCFFPKATHICYGDSIGIYTDTSYLARKKHKKYKILRRLKRFLFSKLRVLGNNQITSNVPIKEEPVYSFGFFSCSTAGGMEPPFRSYLTDISVLVNGFHMLTKRFPPFMFEHVKMDDEDISLTVLITSTQSEWGRMTRKNEVEAYVAFVKRHATAKKILIKPHPREEPAKIMELYKRLEDSGYIVITFPDDNELTSIPIESLLLSLKKDYNLNILCTSSSAFGVALILGIKPLIGFGSKLVKRFFNSDFRSARNEHEQLLRRYTKFYHKIRKNVN